jgi:hypothetical protein
MINQGSEMDRVCSTHARGAYKIFVKNSERKIPLGRPSRSSEDNIKSGSYGNRVGIVD